MNRLKTIWWLFAGVLAMVALLHAGVDPSATQDEDVKLALDAMLEQAKGEVEAITADELARLRAATGDVPVAELAALVLALSIYTGAFIAEAVRSGIMAVSHGQTEAAFALGLRPRVGPDG